MEPRYVIGGLTAGALVLCWGGKWGGSSPPPSKRAEAGMLGEKSVYRDLVASSSNVRSLAFKPQGGGKIPAIGFGTATLFGNQCKVAVTDAIKLGYRHIDTALLYANHEAVGAGIRASGVPRDQLWVTSKIAFFPPKAKGLWMYEGIGPAGRKTSPDSVGKNNEKGGEAASVDLALKQLGMDSVDLLLIHNPASSRPEYNAACMPHFYELIGSLPPVLRLPISGFWRLVNTLTGPGGMSSASRDVRAASWKALEAAQKAGKCKYIGVSNYPPALLEEMKGYATVLPAVNQLELHPRFSSPALRKLAKEMGIVLTGCECCMAIP
eukprot:COSAG05_NODE_52_length_23775_cov_49.471110_2_plen_323_part_00